MTPTFYTGAVNITYSVSATNGLATLSGRVKLQGFGPASGADGATGGGSAGIAPVIVPTLGNAATISPPAAAQTGIRSIFWGLTGTGVNCTNPITLTLVLFVVALLVGGVLTFCRRSATVNTDTYLVVPFWRSLATHHAWLSLLLPCHHHCVTVHVVQTFSHVLTLLALPAALSAWLGLGHQVGLEYLVAGLTILISQAPRPILSYGFWVFEMKYRQYFGGSSHSSSSGSPRSVFAHTPNAKMSHLLLQSLRRGNTFVSPTSGHLEDLDNIEVISTDGEEEDDDNTEPHFSASSDTSSIHRMRVGDVDSDGRMTPQPETTTRSSHSDPSTSAADLSPLPLTKSTLRRTAFELDSSPLQPGASRAKYFLSEGQGSNSSPSMYAVTPSQIQLVEKDATCCLPPALREAPLLPPSYDVVVQPYRRRTFFAHIVYVLLIAALGYYYTIAVDTVSTCSVLERSWLITVVGDAVIAQSVVVALVAAYRWFTAPVEDDDDENVAEEMQGKEGEKKQGNQGCATDPKGDTKKEKKKKSSSAILWSELHPYPGEVRYVV